MIKQWGDLTLLEQKRRKLLAEEGIVCLQCGKTVSSIVYMCAGCQEQHDREVEAQYDYWEYRSYDENGEEHVRIVLKDTGELFDEFTTVSICEEITDEQRWAMIDWARENY